MKSYHEIIKRLWENYTEQNPEVKKVYNLFHEMEGRVLNDHIAIRTFDHPGMNIKVLSRPFINAGYRKSGDYTFEDKHLNASHFEHTDFPEAPLVFISELRTGDFSPAFQSLTDKIIGQIDAHRMLSEDLIFDTEIFGFPSFQIYEQLLAESEYAGWLYVNGFRANHFTVSINANKKLDTLEKANQFLKDHGFRINSAGGEIKGTPLELLEQSSIMANRIRVHFREGEKEVPGCYYEFAKRYPDADGQLFKGFIAKSADRIFQSTDTR